MFCMLRAEVPHIRQDALRAELLRGMHELQAAAAGVAGRTRVEPEGAVVLAPAAARPGPAAAVALSLDAEAGRSVGFEVVAPSRAARAPWLSLEPARGVVAPGSKVRRAR